MRAWAPPVRRLVSALARCARSVTTEPARAEPVPRARSAGVGDGAGFAEDGDFDLAGILQFVLDAARDVFREPDGFLVGDAFALDQDANLAARLQREGFGDALERVGDAFELFEALHVRLEDVAARAGAGGRD